MRAIIVFVVSLLMGISLFAQEVRNVSYTLLDDGKIDVKYDLSRSLTISLYVSIDGGVTFNGPLAAVSGHVGCDVLPGVSRHIIWDATLGYDKIPEKLLQFKVVPRVLGDIFFKMIFVRGGTFDMGNKEMAADGVISDEVPVHEVTLSDFWMSETEVTQKQWVTIMGYNPSFFLGDSLPVDNITLNEARKFVFKLREMTGEKYRLPTEAEWEYAARDGYHKSSYKYSGGDNLDEVGWTKSNSGKTTHEVKTKMPNALGLYDMTGNVMEWCSDIYGLYSEVDAINPQGALESCTIKKTPTGWEVVSGGEPYYVIRGASWNSSEKNCYLLKRNKGRQTHKKYTFGLRLVKEK